MRLRIGWVFAVSLALATPVLARHHHHHDGSPGDGFDGATLLIIRHAEKPTSGPDLSPAGELRAKEYLKYFSPVASTATMKTFWSSEPPQKIDELVATADSAKSSRPRLTITPLSQSINLKINQPCADKDVKGLATWLGTQPANQTVLIAWHHGEMPKLLKALGADADTLIPGGKWPGSEFGWVMELHYDAKGRLISQRRVEEGSLATDN